MDLCREKGGVPPGAGGEASLTIAKLNFTRGSPGRGWGGVVDDREAELHQGFPRARVGWRHWRTHCTSKKGVPPGAGGVAADVSEEKKDRFGSPGRGWGGDIQRLTIVMRCWFPRARVGWRSFRVPLPFSF